MLKKLSTALKALMVWLLALPAYAQIRVPPELSPINLGGFGGIINFIQTVVNAAAVVFVALAFLLFLYAAYLFLTAGGSEERTTKAKGYLFWALIGIVVALFTFAIFAIVRTFLQPAGQ